MSWLSLHRIAAVLLSVGFLGHTFGGMLGTTRHGPKSGPEADAVLASMRAVTFRWQGAPCTWYRFLMGNGLGVSALLILAITVLWVLGGLEPGQRAAVLPIAWAAFVSLFLVGVLGFAYFAPGVGVAFGAVAILCGIAAVRWSIAAGG